MAILDQHVTNIRWSSGPADYDAQMDVPPALRFVHCPSLETSLLKRSKVLASSTPTSQSPSQKASTPSKSWR